MTDKQYETECFYPLKFFPTIRVPSRSEATILMCEKLGGVARTVGDILLGKKGSNTRERDVAYLIDKILISYSLLYSGFWLNVRWLEEFLPPENVLVLFDFIYDNHYCSKEHCNAIISMKVRLFKCLGMTFSIIKHRLWIFYVDVERCTKYQD